MVRNSRRFKLLTQPDVIESSKDHQIFLDTLMSRMIPLGSQTTLMLVPIGHNVVTTKRVHFQKRPNAKTNETEFFLPLDKLERVLIIQSAVIGNRKFFLVHSDTGESNRIVWLRYCANIEAKELVVRFLRE